jgi:hypothetical protein
MNSHWPLDAPRPHRGNPRRLNSNGVPECGSCAGRSQDLAPLHPGHQRRAAAVARSRASMLDALSPACMSGRTPDTPTPPRSRRHRGRGLSWQRANRPALPAPVPATLDAPPRPDSALGAAGHRVPYPARAACPRTTPETEVDPRPKRRPHHYQPTARCASSPRRSPGTASGLDARGRHLRPRPRWILRAGRCAAARYGHYRAERVHRCGQIPTGQGSAPPGSDKGTGRDHLGVRAHFGRFLTSGFIGRGLTWECARGCCDSRFGIKRRNSVSRSMS